MIKTEPTAFTLNWPGKIVFGPGKLVTLGDEAKALGARALVVTTADLARLGLAARVRQALEATGVEVTLFEGVQPDPTCQLVDEMRSSVHSVGAEMVVGLGGGSAIDLAKGVAAAAHQEGPIWDYVTYTGANARALTGPILPVIAIPTTAGTGSEVTQGCVLDNPTLHMKAALLSPRLFPRVAIVDPELTLSLPKAVTALTGFDALTHGIESFLNVERTNPASELFALQAVATVAGYLPRALANGSDHVARSQMCWAATCGGLAIGLANAAVAHAMALPLGARLGIAHGLALALVQPVVLQRTWKAQPERCARLCEAVGAARPGVGVEETARAFAGWVRDFVRQIGLIDLWKAPKPEPNLVDVLANDVLSYMGRPVSQYRPLFSEAQLRQMFDEALHPMPGD